MLNPNHACTDPYQILSYLWTMHYLTALQDPYTCIIITVALRVMNEQNWFWLGEYFWPRRSSTVTDCIFNSIDEDLHETMMKTMMKTIVETLTWLYYHAVLQYSPTQSQWFITATSSCLWQLYSMCRECSPTQYIVHSLSREYVQTSRKYSIKEITHGC